MRGGRSSAFAEAMADAAECGVLSVMGNPKFESRRRAEGSEA